MAEPVIWIINKTGLGAYELWLDTSTDTVVSDTNLLSYGQLATSDILFLFPRERKHQQETISISPDCVYLPASQ